MGHLAARDLQRNKYIMQQQHIKAVMCHVSRVLLLLNLGAVLCPAGITLKPQTVRIYRASQGE
jgi:hypothetical protein